MPWGYAAVAVGSIVAADMGADAAGDAANSQAASGREAIAEQRRAAAEAQGYYAPYAGVAERGIEASQFLGDSQAQYDWLQGNPLFQMGLDNANQQTQASSAARGRLSAGDTLMQLNNNALLTAQPLIDRQRSDVNSLMNYGLQVSSGQANAAIGQGNNVSGLMTDIGNAQAAGQIGQANAYQQGAGNLMNIGMMYGQQNGSFGNNNSNNNLA